MRKSPYLTTAAILGLATCFAAVAPQAHAAQVRNDYKNTTGDYNWNNAGNWDKGNVPVSTDDAILQGANALQKLVKVSSNVATSPGRIAGYDANTLEIDSGGSLSTGHIDTVTGADGLFNVNVTGGALTLNGTIGASNVAITGGALTTVGLTLTDGTYTTGKSPDPVVTHYVPSSFAMSGGAYSGTGTSLIYGVTNLVPTFNITGHAGTFNQSGKNLTMANGTDATTAAQVNFTFGSDADLTTITSGNLSLASNPLTIDFTDIDRDSLANLGMHVTTLFDYSSGSKTGALTGAFATPTFVGLNANESASLVYDSADRQINLDYTIAAVPEPASLALLGLGSLLLLPRRKRANRA